MAVNEFRRRTTIALASILLALLGAQSAAAARYGAGDTGVVDVSHDPTTSAGEEPLSVNPQDPNQLATVANVFEPDFPAALSPFISGSGLQDTRVYSTVDGGAHWLAQKPDQGGIGKLPNPLSAPFGGAPEFADALNVLTTDADSAWDRHGTAYFESGDAHGLYHGGDEQATVWRSSDAGVSWEPHLGFTAISALAEHQELDRAWLALDNSGGPYDGRLYVTFETSAFVDTPPQVLVKHSDDRGRTWSPTVRVDDGLYETQFNARQRPVVGADGTLYVVYDRAPITVTPQLPQLGRIALALARSTDGGRTFARVPLETDVHRAKDPDEAIPGYTELISAIAADQRRAGRVAVAWPEAKGPESSRIMLRYSEDGGRTWSGRIDVADDAAAKADQHDHVTLAYLPDGRLAVGWRDHRCCGGGYADRYQQWVRALTLDGRGGAAPGASVEFTDGPQTGNTAAGRGVLAPDEFQGLVATPLGISLSWSQLAGKLDVLSYRRVPLAAFGAAAPAPSASCVRRRRIVFHVHGRAGQRAATDPAGRRPSSCGACRSRRSGASGRADASRG